MSDMSFALFLESKIFREELKRNQRIEKIRFNPIHGMSWVVVDQQIQTINYQKYEGAILKRFAAVTTVSL